MKKTLLACAVALALPLMAIPAAPASAAVAPVSFDILSEVQEWGPAVTAVIVDAGDIVTQATADTLQIAVNARTLFPTDNAVVYDGPRTVTSVYVATAQERVAPAARVDAGRYIVVELKHGFNDTSAQVDGSAAQRYSSTAATAYAWPLILDYTVLVDGAAVPYGTTIRPIVDDFEYVTNPVAGYTNQHYRLYSPPGSAGQALPLVLFNHGWGETYQYSGGLSNEGQTLVAQEAAVTWINNAPADTYVLVPQRGSGTGAPGYSRPGVIAYINDLIAQGKVDADRVYLTGLSQGGGESHSYLREYPDVFAAAIVICPLSGSSLTAAQVAVFAHVPIWYVHGAADAVVAPTNSTTPYSHLLAAGARDARLTVYPAVATANGNRSTFGVDLPNADYLGNDGLPLAYYPNGHWSWVMMFNNLEVADGGIAGSVGQATTYMDWLFAQQRARSVQFVSVEPNGDTATITTALNLTFDSVIEGLTADDIMVTGASVTGALSGDGPVYTLPVRLDAPQLCAAGQAEVTVTLPWQDGYRFIPASASTTVYLADVVDTIDLSATVKTLTGRTNQLTISLTETTYCGAASTFTETFTIANNAAGTYQLGGHDVYVDTKGNDQVRALHLA
jgi:predicted peptidase